MNCYKFNFLFLFILPCILFGQDNVFSEFKVELIIFKYTDFETNESFKSTFEIPYEDIIYLSDQNSLKNEFEYSNFSNMSSYYKNLFNNNNKVSLSELPEPIFRDSTDLNILEKLKNKINQNSEYQLIDTKSWIQTIPSLESSKFLQYEDKKNYGFFLKFYKKRFMHIILKSYLGTLDNSNNLKIFIDVEKRIFDNEIHFFDHPHFGVIVSINGV